VAVNTNIEQRSLPAALRKSASAFAAHEAVVFGGRRIDYAAFDRLSDRIATALVSQGLSKGDRVGLYCINSDAFPMAYFGILKAGGVVVPLNLLLNPKEIAFILHDAGAKALCYHEAFADAVSAISSETPDIRFRIGIGEKKAFADDLDFSEILATKTVPPEITFDPADDLAVILYTSGTTGRPKGAMLTHKNLLTNAASIIEALGIESGKDIFLVVLPMFHAFAATAGMLAPLFSGGTIVPLPRFDPEQIANTIAEESATIFMGVPSMYNVLLRLPDAYTTKFESLKFGVSGGAAMPVEVMKQFETRFNKLIYEGDGPTECSPVTCVNPIGGVRKPASVGVPVPRVEMKIMDDQGKELPLGEIGEICVRGPNVMKGYWNLPEDTAAAFFGKWFRTGDLGTEDEDGYFFIVDRKKDMIIVNGMNVYPRIIEEVLYRHPAIHEAAVVGERHKLHGEIPVAYLSLKNSEKATAADIRKFCAEHIGRHEVPKRVIFMDELPKNAAGKIVKRELRKHGEHERGVNISFG